MLTSIVLPLFGLLSIYHTFHTLIQYIQNPLQAALQEATNAFNEMLHSFGYTQKLEHYDPHQHRAHPPQQHPLYN